MSVLVVLLTLVSSAPARACGAPIIVVDDVALSDDGEAFDEPPEPRGRGPPQGRAIVRPTAEVPVLSVRPAATSSLQFPSPPSAGPAPTECLT